MAQYYDFFFFFYSFVYVLNSKFFNWISVLIILSNLKIRFFLWLIYFYYSFYSNFIINLFLFTFSLLLIIIYSYYLLLFKMTRYEWTGNWEQMERVFFSLSNEEEANMVRFGRVIQMSVKNRNVNVNVMSVKKINRNSVSKQYMECLQNWLLWVCVLKRVKKKVLKKGCRERWIMGIAYAALVQK